MYKTKQKLQRPIITQDQIDLTWRMARNHFILRRNEKGNGSFASPAEGQGYIDQEVRELKDEIHIRNYKNIEHELMDTITACMWLLAGLNAGTLEY